MSQTSMKPSEECMDAREVLSAMMRGRQCRATDVDKLQLSLKLASADKELKDPSACLFNLVWDKVYPRSDISVLTTYDGVTEGEPYLADYYRKRPTHTSHCERGHTHKGCMLDAQNTLNDNEARMAVVKFIQNFHPRAFIRKNIKEFDRNRMNNDFLKEAAQCKKDYDKCGAGVLGMDLHCWVADKDGNVVYDPLTPNTEFARWYWDYVEGSDVYVPYSERNQSEKWKLLQCRMRAEKEYCGATLKPYYKKPVSSQCHKNAAAYVQQHRKLGRTDLKIVIGSHGWKCENGDFYWKWGDGSDGSFTTFDHIIKNIRYEPLTDEDKVEAGVKECMDEIRKETKCDGMPMGVILRKYGDRLGDAVVMKGVSGTPPEIGAKVIKHILSMKRDQQSQQS